MFDSLARRYDVMNDVLSIGLTRRWRRVVAEEISPLPGMRILDLAAGTGTSSVPLHEAGAEVVAADFSSGMVAEGIRRHPEIEFVQADAMDLPFEDESFDVVTMSFGLRNVKDPDAALRELLRVTKPGGRLLICEFSHPVHRLFARLYDVYLTRILPRVAGAFTRRQDSYSYLAESISAWPDQEEFGRWVLRAGWSRVAYRNLAGGVVALHRGVRPDVASDR